VKTIMGSMQHAFDVHGGRYDGVIGQSLRSAVRAVGGDTVADAPRDGVVLDAAPGRAGSR